MTKRFLELWTMLPGARESFAADSGAFLAAHGLSALEPLSLKILAERETALAYRDCPAEELPRGVRRYRRFVREKFASRDDMTKRLCIPAHEGMRSWRERQVNRCWAELGGKNASLIHTPLMFELTAGCSVGCPFCGVAARSLQAVCARTAENVALWREILRWLHGFVGEAAGSGTCYYATEPLDHPQYEDFADDFYDEFGRDPQLTTAVALRRPERTRALLARMRRRGMRIHRFSVLSLEAFRQIVAFFAPEELLEVELLPQFAEAPACAFSNAGRARAFEARDKVKAGDDDATICCVSGFVVNLAERSVRLLTPCRVDEAHPTGERVLAQGRFADAREFASLVEAMTAAHMPRHMPKDSVLSFIDGLQWERVAQGAQFRRNAYRLSFADPEREKLYETLAALIEPGRYTALEIAALAERDCRLDAAGVFYGLHRLYAAGLLR